MTEEGPAEEVHITFNIKSSSDAKYVLTVPINTTVRDLKEKLSTSEYADLPVDRQRLIYSGRVLKDPDTLASIKIKDGHTVHLVKGAESNARQNPTNQGSSASSAGATPAIPQLPQNLATGTGNNPLAGLTGARYAGFHGLPGADMFGPDGGLGAPPGPDQFLNMMDDPNFLSQLNEAMNNPAVIEMMQNSPMLRDQPAARQMLQNPELRRLLLDPTMIRAQLQMQRAMNTNRSSFPAPGATNTTPQDQPASTSPPPQSAAANPFATMFGSGGGANPFAAFGTTPATSPPPTASAGQGTPQTQQTPSTQTGQNNNQPNPFASLFGMPPGDNGQNTAANQTGNPFMEMTQRLMQNPEAMRAAMQMMAGMGAPNSPFGDASAPGGDMDANAAGNPFASLFNPMTAAAPPDNRPPEERYADQLRQLNDMGFYEFERNVQALRRSGGSVQGAVEYLLNNM